MRFAKLLGLFMALSIGLFAQKGKVEGKVIDSKTGLQLSGVNISINGEKTAAATNTDGYFQVTLDAGKKYVIKLTSIGYSPKEVSDVEVKANDVTHFDVTLDIVSKTETGVVVKSSVRKESVAALIS